MLCTFIFLLYITASSCSEESDTNDIGNKLDDTVTPTTLKQNASIESSGEDKLDVPWDTYIGALIKATRKQLDVTKNNIIVFYKLKPADGKQVNEAFTSPGELYEDLVRNNLQDLIEKKQFNETLDFMLDFLDLSNFLVEQIIELQLQKIGGKLLLPTKWYKQIMRQKIFRQQKKIITNYVEAHICTTLSICKDRTVYTQYLTEWLRHMMSLPASKLKELFMSIPDLLQKHLHTIKSNIKFRKTVKYIVTSDEVVQRDTVDYIDEVINEQKNVINLVPSALKKGAVLLMELFKVIDSNYDINEDNEDELESISQLIKDWMIGQKKVDIKQALENILLNMQINMKIWPLAAQTKIEVLWGQVIQL